MAAVFESQMIIVREEAVQNKGSLILPVFLILMLFIGGCNLFEAYRVGVGSAEPEYGDIVLEEDSSSSESDSSVSGELGQDTPEVKSANQYDSEGPGFTLEPDDPLDLLYRPSLSMGSDGLPLVSIRIMSARKEIRVRARSEALVLKPRPKGTEPAGILQAPKGTTLILIIEDHVPGQNLYYPIVADLPAGHRSQDALLEEIRKWTLLGYELRVESLGSIFGLGGRVVDNRRMLILLDGPGDKRWAARAAEDAAEHLEQTPVLHEIRVRRPSANIIVRDEGGATLARGYEHISLSAAEGGLIEVLSVEYGLGYAWHGREDRAYAGRLHLAADDRGLSLINTVSIEELLRGVVPAEIFASAPIEALKAQAVTARTHILAKVGTRHLSDPALICAETHCQVYKGADAVAASTDAAIRMTLGEVLVGDDGRLIDAVYSAMCGGHTESNEVVWGTPPDPSLRGRADFLAKGEWLAFAAGIGEDDLDKWLSSNPPSWCGLSSMGAKSRYRWTRTISAQEMDSFVAHLGVGSVRSIDILGRGVSGRVRAIRITGTLGSRVVRRELPVRRLFANLNSGMFIVSIVRDDTGTPVEFVFKGGGWGHGVGMCQTGAIGMAEHSYDYRAILRHYYNGASISSIY